MEGFNPAALHQATLVATDHLAAIADMLRVIRDHVAPMISEHDLERVDTRHSVRARIFPHPTLRRATMAAEAAQAAMRRAQECMASARSVFEATAHLAPAVRHAEARHWAQQATRHLETITRAHAAVCSELARVRAGTATIADVPPPTVSAPGRP